MAFLDHVLETPSYGWQVQGRLHGPSVTELLRETFRRLNIIKRREGWLPLLCWVASFSLSIPLVIFLFKYFSWPLAVVGFLYSMVVLGSHGTFWLHRYSTHRAYQFTNRFWRFVGKHLVIRLIPEELYVVSHHVHHYMAERPGDPYNVNGGWWYCFLADTNHQLISQSLSEEDYEKVRNLLSHTGIYTNSFTQYQKWGSVSHPFFTFLEFFLSWVFWYGMFFLLGGHALATALFGSSMVWALGVRTFNFQGHGGGKDLRREGIDFNQKDLSVNQWWPGWVAGEWHNNHHLFPRSAKCGFLPHQLDLPWLLITVFHKLGGIHSMRNSTKDFFMRHYRVPHKLAISSPSA